MVLARVEEVVGAGFVRLPAFEQANHLAWYRRKVGGYGKETDRLWERVILYDKDGAFEGEKEGPDLEGLRTTFQHKSFVSWQERLCRTLLADGRSPAELAEIPLGDVPPSGDSEAYLARRSELEPDVSAEAALVVDPDGNRVPEDAVVQHLRFARLTWVSIEGNAGLCRELLATRYGEFSGVAR